MNITNFALTTSWNKMIYIYTQVHLKKLNIMKNVNILCHSFQKVKSIYYIDSLQSEIFQSFISWDFDDYGLEIMKPKIKCLRKFLYYIRSIKKDILNRNLIWNRLLKSMFISMLSILGLVSFCMNYCINVAWHGDNQPVALLRCNESTGYFDNSLQVICIVGSGVSHLLYNTP